MSDQNSDNEVLQHFDSMNPDLTCDPAEEACYDIQKACWAFQTAIERAETTGRLAFIDGMLAESRKRLDLVIVAVGARQTEIETC